MPKASYQRVNIDSEAEPAISLMSGKQRWLLRYQRVSNRGLCLMDKGQKAKCPLIRIHLRSWKWILELSNDSNNLVMPSPKLLVT